MNTKLSPGQFSLLSYEDQARFVNLLVGDSLRTRRSDPVGYITFRVSGYLSRSSQEFFREIVRHLDQAEHEEARRRQTGVQIDDYLQPVTDALVKVLGDDQPSTRDDAQALAATAVTAYREHLVRKTLGDRRLIVERMTEALINAIAEKGPFKFWDQRDNHNRRIWIDAMSAAVDVLRDELAKGDIDAEAE